jgi:hypothetical protein
VETFPLAQVKPGLKATAWTVFEGGTPEPVPIEVIGLLRNSWGPKQDIIVAKMGGKAQRTNVAGGMSGSPVYVDGKLMGAVSLRMSVFSPDAICGITPIDYMLEINDFDATRPAEAKVPGQVPPRAGIQLPPGMLQQVIAAGTQIPTDAAPMMVPIETPLVMSGFSESVLREFGGFFQQMGVKPVQGGGASTALNAKPVPGWANALQPGDAVAGLLVSGDMSMTGTGTVTYNDGKRVLAFGHPFFNLGPVHMPMAKADIVMVLASAFQPNKMANAGDIVGALRQDRHSGIMGHLGDTAETVPVSVNIRSFGADNQIRKQKTLNFQVFVQQKWTPFLMMVTLFNSMEGMNDFADDTTFRLSGTVDVAGQGSISLRNMQAPSELPIPAPMILAGWWGDKFNRLFQNPVQTPRLSRVNATIDLLPQRRTAAIETAILGAPEVDAGGEVPVRVFLRPFRGERVVRDFTVKIPASLARGDYRILLSDADTLNRAQSFAAMGNRFLDLPQTVSLLNQERSNHKLYVSLVEPRPTVYTEDKSLPNLPPSVLNVMQTGRAASRLLFSAPETTNEQMSLEFDHVVSGSTALKITVR